MPLGKSSIKNKKNVWNGVWLGIGELIRNKRLTLGMSQTDLANEIGFSAQFLGRIESGKCPLPKEAFVKITAVLNLDRKKVSKIYIDAAHEYLSSLFAESSQLPARKKLRQKN